MEKLNNTYFLVDVGANLTNKKYRRDLDSVIERSKNSGIRKIIVTGISMNSNKEALRLTRLYPNLLYCTIGVHPYEAKSWDEFTYNNLKKLAMNEECVAVGECGLDFSRNFSSPEIQLEVFEKHIQLSIELKKTLFLHEKDAHKELMNLLNKYKNKLPSVFIHCFTGDEITLKTYLDAGFFIGLTGFFCKDKLKNGVQKCLFENKIPLDRLVVETDSPFMYPNVRNNKLPENVRKSLTENSLSYLNRYCNFNRNEPCSLPCIVEMIAAFMNESAENVALYTTLNAFKVFGLEA